MSRARRKWASGHAGWRIHWTDSSTFKVEQEADNLTDASMEEWGGWMDSQFERKWGRDKELRPKLVASTLNFSRNELGDEGVRCVVEYLKRNKISVQMIKFFKNSIGDVGAWAIGQLMANSPEPVQEVHLSHNRISEQGAASIFEAIAKSGRYPHSSERAGRRDPRGMTPVWLRMEYNCINWAAIESRLEVQQVRWCTAESRDGWSPKDAAPMVCMHQSYRNQKVESMGQPRDRDHDRGHRDRQHTQAMPEWATASAEESVSLDAMSAVTFANHGRGREAPLNGQHLLAALQGDRVAKETLASQLGQATASAGTMVGGGVVVGSSANAVANPNESSDVQSGEEVPMYIFLDASAVRRMMASEDGLFTFQGLLNLCQQGHMKCEPPLGRGMPRWLGQVEERDRIIFVVTDSVLDELQERADNGSPGERKRIDWLRNDPESYLQLCHVWGILEVLETRLHTQLMKLTAAHEQQANEVGITRRTVKWFDFAYLWESHIDSEGRVMFVTADEGLRKFGTETLDLTSEGCTFRRIAVLHLDELYDRFKADRTHGGARLCEAALKTKVGRFCGAVLSAQVVAAVLAARPSEDAEDRRREQRESLSSDIQSGEEVPMYIFLDASSVRKMMASEEGIFTFQGLLNLCQQGHMKCEAPPGRGMPQWLGQVEERDRIIFVVTDSVLDELQERADKGSPGERKRIEWLRSDTESYLQLCHKWGILEVLETRLHTQLMKLTAMHEQQAREVGISRRTLKWFDFAYLWESHIDSEGRVIFVTADEILRRFGSETLDVNCEGCSLRKIAVLHLDDLYERFKADRTHGGARLCEAALKPKAGKFCGTVLSAQVVAAVLAARPPDEAEVLRRELREAMALLAEARHILGGTRGTNANGNGSLGADAAKCVGKMDDAQVRWEALLARGDGPTTVQ